MSLTPGSTFGPYRIIEALGRGGMASVYKAYEPGLDRFVALKVLPAEFLHEPTFAERFEREAKVIAKLEHPNIIPIFAFGIEAGIPWMAMRLIAGGSLSTVLRERRLELGRIVAILSDVASALDYAHGKGVIHRDVKPQNILADEHERVYLADFGIAKIVEGSVALTQTGMISGTPQYMAPEQATAAKVDERADIYALGIVAYEMLTGRVPFAADTPVAVLMKHVTEPIPMPSRDRVPELLLRPLLKCLAKAPADRWSKASEFARAMADSLAKVSTMAPSAPPTVALPEAPPTIPTPGRKAPSRALLLGAVVAVGVAAAAVGLFMARPWAPRESAAGPGPPPSTLAPLAEPSASVVVEPAPSPMAAAVSTPAAPVRTPHAGLETPTRRAPAPLPSARVAEATPPPPPTEEPRAAPAPAAAPEPPPPAATHAIHLDVDAAQDPYGGFTVDALYLQVQLDGRPIRNITLTFEGKDAFARSRKRQQFEITGVPEGRHLLTLLVSDDPKMGGGAGHGSTEVNVQVDTRLSVQVRERTGGAREVRFR